jgi:hypothetical protein
MRGDSRQLGAKSANRVKLAAFLSLKSYPFYLDPAIVSLFS